MSNTKKQLGFTLIELLIVVTIIGILAAIAIPSYNSSVIKASRAAAQTDLMQMAALQEKIYLNSNAYSTSITAAYTAQSGGGLGWSSQSKDQKYNYSCTNCTTSVFTITAAPVTTSAQANDGTLSIDSTGQRLWTGGSASTW